MNQSQPITGCILAGGRARRFDGKDKGLLPLAGRPLTAHVFDRLQDQVHEILISANRNAHRYAAIGAPVVADTSDAYAGPLAGCLAAMRSTRSPWLVIVPCDGPFVPLDLVTRLLNGARAKNTQLSVATAAGRLQPVYALLATALADDLESYLASGERRVDAWYARHAHARVDFGASDAPFFNINSHADLEFAKGRQKQRA